MRARLTVRIAMVSDVEQRGGAGTAATRLADALVGRGHEVVRVIGRPDRPGVWRSEHLRSPVRIQRGLEMVHLPPLGDGRARARLGRMLASLAPDVVSVHNLHGARWTPGVAAVCNDRAPAVWTLHDMWSFTGRCAFNDGCDLFLTGCTARCPTPRDYPRLPAGRIAAAWEGRRSLFDSSPDLSAVSPSRWLADAAVAGLWRDHRVDVVPNGLPLDCFAPRNRQDCRRRLGVDDGGPVVLALAADVTDPRKGLRHLVDALGMRGGRRLTLLVGGSGALDVDVAGVRVVPLGAIADTGRLVDVYNAADVLVHPALEDNYPNVVAESIAVGTPVVAFPVGGLPELVLPGVTGHLAGAVTPEALARTIDVALETGADGGGLRAACRTWAEGNLGSDRQAEHYERIFVDRIAGRRAG